MNSKWPSVCIEDICETIVDCLNRTAPATEQTTPYKMIRTTNVRNGWIDLSTVKYVDKPTFEKWTRRQVPQKGDIILTREAPLGEVGMIRSSDQVFLGQRLVSYRVDPLKADNRFLLYSFQAHDLQSQIKALGSGSTVEHMRVPDAKNLMVKTPPLDIQKRIGDILSTYDDLIENNTRRIAILEEMARRLYEEWFVHFRFPGHENVNFTETEQGRTPKGWQLSHLNDLVDFVKIPTRPGDHLSDREYVPIDCIGRATLALQETKSWTEANSSLILFEEDDILFGAMRPYFHKVAIAPFPGVTRSTCFVLRSKIERAWAFSVLTAFHQKTISYASAHCKGATIPYAVWEGSLENFEVLMPTNELLERFEQRVRPILHWIKKQCRKNSNLRTQRDLLLPRLVSGEIDVTEVKENLEEAVA